MIALFKRAILIINRVFENIYQIVSRRNTQQWKKICNFFLMLFFLVTFGSSDNKELQTCLAHLSLSISHKLRFSGLSIRQVFRMKNYS